MYVTDSCKNGQGAPPNTSQAWGRWQVSGQKDERPLDLAGGGRGALPGAVLAPRHPHCLRTQQPACSLHACSPAGRLFCSTERPPRASPHTCTASPQAPAAIGDHGISLAVRALGRASRGVKAEPYAAEPRASASASAGAVSRPGGHTVCTLASALAAFQALNALGGAPPTLSPAGRTEGRRPSQQVLFSCRKSPTLACLTE